MSTWPILWVFVGQTCPMMLLSGLVELPGAGGPG